MKTNFLIAFFCCLFFDISAQTIDPNFFRTGVRVFKQVGMESSNIVDFDVLEEGRMNVLYASEGQKHLVRLQKDGFDNVTFKTQDSNLGDKYTIPVAIASMTDGSVLVLSNIWNGFSWMVAINKFYDDGTIDQSFGRSGLYKEKIVGGLEDNYAKHMYISLQNEIIIVAKVNQFDLSKEKERIAILKVSDIGTTLFSDLYDDQDFTLNCAAMDSNRLLLGYSESLDDGQDQATYLVGLDSESMQSNSMDCFSIEAGYQSFDHLVFTDDALYASYIQSDIDNLYSIRKYNSQGLLDESFRTSGVMHFDADIYATDFVANKKGEVFVVSLSLDSRKEMLIKKLLPDGGEDTEFGINGVATISLNYPISELNKIQLDTDHGLFISGSCDIEGSSYGFITKLKLNVEKVKKEKLDKFLDNLFVNN